MRGTSAEPRIVHETETEHRITALAADDTGLYVVEAGSILEIGRSGPSRVHVSRPVCSHRLALDEGHVYWTEFDDSGDSVWRVPKCGGTATRIEPRKAIATRFASSSREWDGPTRSELVSFGAIDGVVHWIERWVECDPEARGERSPYDRTLGCRIVRAAGDEAVELPFSFYGEMDNLHADDDAFFWIERGVWTDRECRLMSMPRAGGPVTARWSFHEGIPRLLAFDGEHYVWADYSKNLYASRRDGATSRIPCHAEPASIAAARGSVIALLVGQGFNTNQEVVRILPNAGVVEPLARFEAGRSHHLAVGGGRAYFGARKLWEIDLIRSSTR